MGVQGKALGRPVMMVRRLEPRYSHASGCTGALAHANARETGLGQGRESRVGAYGGLR